MHRQRTKLSARMNRVFTHRADGVAKAIERQGIRATYELHDRVLGNRGARRRYSHEPPALDAVQQGVVDRLGEDGWEAVGITPRTRTSFATSAAYARYADRLADELGLEPSPVMQELWLRILRQQVATPTPLRELRPHHVSVDGRQIAVATVGSGRSIVALPSFPVTSTTSTSSAPSRERIRPPVSSRSSAEISSTSAARLRRMRRTFPAALRTAGITAGVVIEPPETGL